LLSKPYRKESLARAVREALRRAAARAAPRADNEGGPGPTVSTAVRNP